MPHPTAAALPTNHQDKRHFKFLIHTFDATGHVLPMQAVAKELVDHGHHVVWLSSESQRSRVLASGATFVEATEVAIVNAALRAADPKDIPGCVKALFDGRVLAQVADFRRVLKDYSADCLLIDALPQGASSLFDLGEVPVWVTLGVVPMYMSTFDMLPEISESIYEPNSALGTIFSRPELILPNINEQREHLGLRPLHPSDPLHYSPFLHLQASCPMLELKNPSVPKPSKIPVHYVGPLVLPDSRANPPRPPWWDDVVDHPNVIGITQGTFAIDPSLLLAPAIEALSQDPSLLLVVPSARADELRQRVTTSNNVRIANWVPYDLLLPRCRLLITNGGYGSVTQALSHGVPIICAGTSEDKKDTAARVTWVGAGIDIGTDTPSATQIREGVREVLGNPKYKKNAERLALELNGLGGAARACSLLEEVVRKAVEI